MLFDVLFVAMVIYTMITPFFYVKAIKFGMDLWEDPDDAGFFDFHLPKKPKEVEISDADKRTMQILQNIDRYDGTPNGQVKVK